MYKNVCGTRATQTLEKHHIMHACLAFAFTLAAAVLGAPDRLGYNRDIESNRYYQMLKLSDYVLNDKVLGAQKTRAKLVTRPRPDEPVVADNVILESNVIRLVKPAKRDVNSEAGQELVRRRRGYNLENVRVPARYPYLPVPSYSRFRRWG